MAEVKHEITYLSDVEGILTVSATPKDGNIPVFGDKTALGTAVKDSGKSMSDFVTQDGIGEAVKSASEGLLSEIRSAYAIKAYSASGWESGHAYSVGDFCQNGGVGYRCTSANSDSGFDENKWEVALTAAGKSAIDSLLASYGLDGVAMLGSIAPEYDSGTTYSVGQLVVKDGVLQVCTKSGRAAAEFSSDTTVEGALASRLSAIASRMPTKVSDLDNDSGFASGASFLPEYDSTDGYKVDAVCLHEGSFFACVKEVDPGAEWDPDSWRKLSFYDLPKNVSSLNNDSGYIGIDIVAKPFDGTKTYSKGDVCIMDGGLVVCNGESGATSADGRLYEWIPKATIGEVIEANSSLTVVNSDWDAESGSPSYIANKPTASDVASAGFVMGKEVVKEYDTTEEYKKGQFCTRGGRFYECIYETTTGEWNQKAWSYSRVEDIIEGKASSMNVAWSRITGSPKIPAVTSDLTNDAGFVYGDSVVGEYNGSGSIVYKEGDLCSFGGKFWKCIAEYAAGAWKEADWLEVSLEDIVDGMIDGHAVKPDWNATKGSSAEILNKPDIPSRVSELTNDSGFVKGQSFFEEFDKTREYKAGETCSKDGKFWKCSANVTGWVPSSWEEIRLTVPTKVSEFENDNGFVYGSSCFDEIKDGVEYSSGDVRTRDGKFWRCNRTTTGWSKAAWDEERLESVIDERIPDRAHEAGYVKAVAIAKEWSDATSYAVGDVCCLDGAFYVCKKATTGAWDKSCWERKLLKDITYDLPFALVEAVEETSGSNDVDYGTQTVFRLTDHAVNSVNLAYSGKSLRLRLPEKPSSGEACELAVTVKTSLPAAYGNNASYDLGFVNGYVKDAGGHAASLKIHVPAGGSTVSFRLASSNADGNGFVIAGFGDYVYNQISSALDELLDSF